MKKVKTLKEANKLASKSSILHIYPTKEKTFKYAVMTHLEWLNWRYRMGIGKTNRIQFYE
jgi:hypothetical protein